MSHHMSVSPPKHFFLLGTAEKLNNEGSIYLYAHMAQNVTQGWV